MLPVILLSYSGHEGSSLHPRPGLKAADELAQRMGVSRSYLYSVAIQRFVQDHDDEAITAKLNEVYDNESSTLDPVLQSIQARSLERGTSGNRARRHLAG